MVLVVAPGASNDTVTALSRLVPAAGGNLVGTVNLGQALVDPGSPPARRPARLPVGRVHQRCDGAGGLTGYARFGFLLGRSVVTRADSGGPLDQTATALSAGISAGHLATFSKDLQRRASLVILVGPAEGTSDGAATATILAAVAGQLAAAGGGVMALTDGVDGAPSALVESIRDDATTSTSVATEDSGRRPRVASWRCSGWRPRPAERSPAGTGDSATSVAP